MIKTNPRNTAIAAAYQDGITIIQLAAQYGVTRQRIQQIVARQGLTRQEGGVREKIRRRLAARMENLNRRCIEKHGMTWPSYRRLMLISKGMRKAGVSFQRTPTGAFQRQRQNARKRGILWDLTIGDWWDIWVRSGKWGERGRGAEKYVMGRNGDIGPYAVGNVKIITQAENVEEYWHSR